MSTPDGYRTDIQGLRAIAVVSVLLFHAFPHGLTGGFVGVDVFFVISGFLISGILYRDMQKGRYSLADFYRKRIRRLFPALFVMLLSTLVVGYAVLSPDAYRELARTAISSTLFLSNVDFYLLSGYFSPAAELKPLLHTWSLAVEEQFYIAFPPLLWLVHRFARRLLMPLLLLVFLLSLLLAQLYLPRDPTAVFFLSPFRVFELLCGVTVSLMTLPAIFARPEARGLAVGAGLAMIALALATYSAETPFPGVAALLPAVGTALVLLAGRGGDSRPARLISSPPFLFFGAISYSLYLWHWPVFSYLRVLSTDGMPSMPVILMALGLAVLAGWLSYRLVEQPFARRSIRHTPLIRMGLAGMCAMCLIAAGIRGAGGLPSRFPPDVLTFFDGAKDYSPERFRCHRGTGDLDYAETCVLGAAGADPHIVVWGDSHGTELAYALAGMLEKDGQALRQITASACPPVVGVDVPDRPNCAAVNAGMLEGIAGDPGIRTVILATNAENYYAKKLPPDTLEAGYDRVIRHLREAGKEVIPVSQIPNPNLEAPTAAGYAARRGGGALARIGRPLDDVRAASADWNARLAGLAEAHGAVPFDPVPLLCAPDFCPVVDGDTRTLLYFNPTHVSVAGARRIAGGLVAAYPELVRPGDTN